MVRALMLWTCLRRGQPGLVLAVARWAPRWRASWSRRSGPFPVWWTRGLGSLCHEGVLRMGSTRRSFTDEYKDEAARFVIDEGRPIVEVARNIGVHEMTLGKWVKKARDGQQAITPADAPLNESERLELIRLRAEVRDKDAENAELRMQVEFAKKVATWFAKGKQ